MQTRKVILSIAIVLILSMLTQPTFAWVYHNNPIDDGVYERFGTRADRLLIKLYAGSPGEEKDQYQENSEVCEHVDTYWTSWQEFVPTATSLSRVEVKINRYENYPNGYHITMTIESPLGSVLTSKTLQWWEVPEGAWGETVWISFDVPDIALTPGQSYYIVLVSEPLAYLWSAADWDAYPPGISNFGYTWDWAFRTFDVGREFGALEAGDIDLTDWPITKTEYNKWTTAPLNASIQVVSYGPEFGLFILDMNSNNNQYLGNPPDPMYPNPVYPNPTSNVGLRRAIAYLVNRAACLADPSIGAGFGFPMYTAMPPAQAKYLLDVTEYPEMPWAYTYSREAANATLDDWGFDTFDADGYRIWNETGETVNLKFYIRNDHPGRKMIGTKLLTELDAVGIKATPYFGTRSFCEGPVTADKDFHLYTGGWSLGIDPDHLILWAWDYYWHPGFCYNYGGHNDPEFNDAALGVMYANTQAEAVTMAYTAQYRMAYMALGVPLYCVAGNKAYHKTYVGNDAGEEGYFGKNWRGVKNILGYGIDNSWSLMNMWPEQTEVMGNGAMTIRWGFMVDEIREWNPIYSQWLFDWNAMNPLYESLLTRNASNLGEFMPNIAKDWTVGTYNLSGVECTKIRFQLRDDVYWSDGVKLSIGDVYFTFKELEQILESRGFPKPWWYSNVADILDFSIIDPCTFEVLLDVKSYWALGWIGGNIILPQHIWRTVATTGDPQATAFDLVRLTGNGPWMAHSYGGIGSTVLHLRNPMYFNSFPVDVSVFAKGETISPQKIKPCTPPANAWFQVNVISNWARSNLIVDKFIYFSNKTASTLTLVKTVPGITLVKGVPHTENVTLAEIAAALGITLTSWPKCSYDIDVRVHVVGPPFVCDAPPPLGPQPNIWICHWKNMSFDWWGTIKEDITGAVYHGLKTAPDCKVDVKDVAKAAKAFGTKPGDARWDTASDIAPAPPDYKIDVKDIASIAMRFGWK